MQVTSVLGWAAACCLSMAAACFAQGSPPASSSSWELLCENLLVEEGAGALAQQEPDAADDLAIELLLTETSTDADVPKTPTKAWEVRFKVYSWISGLDGDAGRGPRPSSVDVDYCDVLESLDEINCMVPINLEARYDRLGVFVDLYYLRLKDETTRGPVQADLLSEQTILEIAGFWRPGLWKWGENGSSSLALDIIGGARYNRVSGTVGLQAAGRGIDIGGGKDWWDPFVGPRVTWRVNEKLELLARGDVGGFGLEHSSHFTWQVIVGADWYITRNIFVELGYRLLDTDYETGSGLRHFTYDLTMQGPYLAIGIRF